MGWNSWDSFGRTINEKEVRGTAEKVAKDLKSSGWQYIVIDEGWYISNPLEQDATRYRFTMTEDGRFIPDPARFPSSAGNSGFKPLADYVHSLGLNSEYIYCAAFRETLPEEIYLLPSPECALVMPPTNLTPARGMLTTSE
jgi:hypothetical protein